VGLDAALVACVVVSLSGDCGTSWCFSLAAPADADAIATMVGRPMVRSVHVAKTTMAQRRKKING